MKNADTSTRRYMLLGSVDSEVFRPPIGLALGTKAVTRPRDSNHRQSVPPIRRFVRIVGCVMPNLKLSPDLYKYLKSAARPIVKRRGTVLFREGRPGRGAFLIRSGEVRMTLGDKSKLYPVRTLGSGSVIGLPATFSGEPYSLTAEAKKDCHLYFVPRRKLLDLLRRNPEVGFNIVRILSEEIFQMRKAARRVAPKRRPVQ